MPSAAVARQIRAATAANDRRALTRLAVTHVADAEVLFAAVKALFQVPPVPNEPLDARVASDTLALVEAAAAALRRHHAGNDLLVRGLCGLLLETVGGPYATELGLERAAVKAGVCEALVAAMWLHSGSPEVQDAVHAVLASVARKDAEGRERALREGAVTAIVASLNSARSAGDTPGGPESLGQPYSGMLALSMLLSECQTAAPQEEAYAAGVLTAAVAAIRKWPRNAAINAQACGCLLSLLMVPLSCTRKPLYITSVDWQAALLAVLAALFEHARDKSVATNSVGALCGLLLAIPDNATLSSQQLCPFGLVLMAQRAHPGDQQVQVACVQALCLLAPLMNTLRTNSALRLGVASAAEAAATAFPHFRSNVDALLAVIAALGGDASAADGAAVIRTRTALAEVAAARAAHDYEAIAQIALVHSAEPSVLSAVLEALLPALNQSPTQVLPERTCSAFADAGLAALRIHADEPNSLCQACGLLRLAVAHPAVATHAINHDGLADALAAAMRRHAASAWLQGAAAGAFVEALRAAAEQANLQILVRASVPEVLVAALTLDTADAQCNMVVMSAFMFLLQFAAHESSATIQAATLARAVPALAAIIRKSMDDQEALRVALICFRRCMPQRTDSKFPELHPAVAADALNVVQAVLLVPQHAALELLHCTGCTAIARLASYAVDGEQTGYDADAAATAVLASLRKHKAVIPQSEGLFALAALLQHPRSCAAAVRRACSDAAAAAVRDHPSLEPLARAITAVLSVTAESGGIAPYCGRPGCGLLPGNGVKLRLCAGCRGVRYCSDGCQRAHWSAHKAACRASAAAAAAV